MSTGRRYRIAKANRFRQRSDIFTMYQRGWSNLSPILGLSFTDHRSFFNGFTWAEVLGGRCFSSCSLGYYDLLCYSNYNDFIATSCRTRRKGFNGYHNVVCLRSVQCYFHITCVHYLCLYSRHKYKT